MWQPDTLPTTNAMAMMDRPNANAMPSVPSVAPAMAALLQPNSVRTNVPSASAPYFFIEDASIVSLSILKKCAGQ